MVLRRERACDGVIDACSWRAIAKHFDKYAPVFGYVPFGRKIIDILIVQRLIARRFNEVVAKIGVEGPIVAVLAKDHIRVIIHFARANFTVGSGRLP